MKRSALVGLLALLPVTVTAGEPSRSNAYTQPHVLRYAEAEDITGLNQVLSQQAVVTQLSQLREPYSLFIPNFFTSAGGYAYNKAFKGLHLNNVTFSDDRMDVDI